MAWLEEKKKHMILGIEHVLAKLPTGQSITQNLWYD